MSGPTALQYKTVIEELTQWQKIHHLHYRESCAGKRKKKTKARAHISRTIWNGVVKVMSVLIVWSHTAAESSNRKTLLPKAEQVPAITGIY